LLQSWAYSKSLL